MLRTLASLEQQTVPASVVVVDNASSDGTAEAVAERHPKVRVVRNERNLGFGAAINRAALELDGDLLVLVNNDVVCEPGFVERITAPFDGRSVGMVAGVLLQAAAPGLVDSAGIELDTTLGSWDYLWNRPAAALGTQSRPVGPCGGAAAYRLPVFQELGGFDETLFAYWEDVDLALRFREAGWRCVTRDRRARAARARADPGRRFSSRAAAGVVRPRLRAREIPRRRPPAAPPGEDRRARLAGARASTCCSGARPAPLRERLRARALGLRSPARRAPLELATVGFGTALRPPGRAAAPPAVRRAAGALQRRCASSRQLVREKLGAPAASEPRRGPGDRPQRAERDAVDAPAGRLEQVHEVAAREPAQMRRRRGARPRV